MFEALFDAIGRIYPKVYSRQVRRYLLYANVSTDPAHFLGIVLLASLALGALGYQIPAAFPKNGVISEGWMGFAALFILTPVVMLMFLAFISEKRTKLLELQLPDALLLISSNMRAGSTIDVAISNVSRHSEQPIKTELEKTSRDLVSNPVEDSLNNFAERNASPVLKNTIELMLFGIRSGGKMADLMDDISHEIRMTSNLQKEVESQISLYKMFLMLVVMFISPAMLAVAANFVVLTQTFSARFQSQLAGADLSAMASGGPAGQLIQKMMSSENQSQIRPEDMVLFGYGMCVVSSIMIAMLLGVIENGNSRGGLKYIPMFLVASLLVFHFANGFAGALMRDMFTGLF